MKIILFVLLLVSAQIEVYAQQKQSKKSWGSRAVPVEVIEAKKTKLYSLTPSYGRIISLEPYSIISKINEEVKKIHVLEGAEVVKGQKLIELENKNIKRLIARYETEILYSKDNLKFLNEELSIINDKLKRFLNLKENKVISNDLFDDLRIKKINLNKQVSKVEFDLKRLSYLLLSSKDDLNNTVIKSPINGNLIKFDVKLGSVLNKGVNIGSILDPTNNEIETSLRSDLASKLKPEFPVQIIIDGKNPKVGDLVVAYNNDVIVGISEYSNDLTILPVMGKDLSIQTESYLNIGESPSLKLHSHQTGEVTDLQFNLAGFDNLLVSHVNKIEVNTQEIPMDLILHPAYPNPFNPVTTIEIGVPFVESLRVTTLRVFDINGHLIETLVNSELSPGNHSIEWDASRYPSGVYFAKLVSGNPSINSGQGFTQSQKLVLIK